MKQTTISKALLYARLDLLKVMFSVALLPKINFIINLAYYRQVARSIESPCNIYQSHAMGSFNEIESEVLVSWAV